MGTTEGSVLVPGIAAPSTVACLRSLGPRGVGTIVGSESASTPAAVSARCDAFVELPDPGTDIDAYGEALLAVAERPEVRTIIPVREEDVYVLSRNRGAFGAEIATPWPSFETLRRVQDRLELFAAAEDAGVAAPETRSLAEWDDWDRETIVKPRYTVAAPAYLGPEAGRVDVGSTRYRSPGRPPDSEAIVRQRGHVPIVQEYVRDSREYGFFALYDRGEPLATFQHCQHRGYKYAGGPSAYRESTAIPELEAAGLALLDHLEWHGLAMVEFLRNPDTGQFELMEINPRFWSSLPFSVRAGVDFPDLYWRLATGQPIERMPDYDVGIGGHLVRGELSYLHSVATEEYPLVDRPAFATALRQVATSVVRERRFDYAVADDPLPFVQDGWNTLRACAGEWLRRYRGTELEAIEPPTAETASGRPTASEPPRPPADRE